MKDDRPTERPEPLPPITFADLGRSLWHSLKQMRTVVWLLGLIAGLGWLGSLVPQGEAPETYTTRFGPLLGGLILRLGADHLYRTTGFLLLLLLVILSLVACSGRMWVQTRLRRKRPDADSAARQAKVAAGTVEGSVKLTADGATTALAHAAARRGYRLHRLGEAGDRQWFQLTKHRWSAWGPALAHYAVFLVALGAIIGTLPGLSVDRYVDVSEGQTYKDPDGQLPFQLQLHSFHITRVPGSGAVGNYYSDLGVIVQGKEVARQAVSVNHPLRYGSFYLSQASWGLNDAHVQVTEGGHTTDLTFPLERGCPAEGGEAGWAVSDKGRAAFYSERQAALVATGFYADAERRDGKVLGRKDDLPGKPALSLMMVSGFKTQSHSMKELGWLFPGEEVAIPGGTAKFVGATSYTGLGVCKDVGVPFVWMGFLGCTLGLMMIFYFPLQTATAALRSAGRTSTVVSIAFSSRSGEPTEAASAVWTALLAELSAAGSSRSLLREELPDV